MEVSGFFEQDVVDLTHDDEPDASLSSTLEAVASYNGQMVTQEKQIS